MNDQEKRLQKRFTGFLVCSGLLFAGLFVADPSQFGTYSQMIAGAYAVYLGGQSWTDHTKAKNGG